MAPRWFAILATFLFCVWTGEARAAAQLAEQLTPTTQWSRRADSAQGPRYRLRGTESADGARTGVQHSARLQSARLPLRYQLQDLLPGAAARRVRIERPVESPELALIVGGIITTAIGVSIFVAGIITLVLIGENDLAIAGGVTSGIGTGLLIAGSIAYQRHRRESGLTFRF